MFEEYNIIVYSAYIIPYRVRRKLKKWLYYDRLNNQYYGNVSSTFYRKINTYCKEHNLKCKLNNNFAQRSNDYRSNFFKTYKPIFKNYYFCSYCGRLVPKKRITVDHLYPVDAAKTSIKLQKKLKRKGITSINDVKNLVPACYDCNRKKSNKTGNWIWQGRIGQIQSLWILRHFIRISLLCIGLCLFL